MLASLIDESVKLVYCFILNVGDKRGKLALWLSRVGALLQLNRKLKHESILQGARVIIASLQSAKQRPSIAQFTIGMLKAARKLTTHGQMRVLIVAPKAFEGIFGTLVF